MNDCIMKPNDYIAASDVNNLTADQWQQFREYLRGYGHRIDEESGQRVSMYDHWCVVLDDYGDLIWCDDSGPYDNQVTYEQIMETIQQKCIMKIDDYVCGDDVNRLTCTQWEQFREYLKSHGYRVANGYGHYGSSYSDKWRVLLGDYGDLIWCDDSSPYGNRITYEQIIQAIQSIQSIQPQSLCVMQACDYISYSDVHKLSAEQWHKFREYLRGYGHRVSDRYGNQTATNGVDYWYIELDCDGDLTWRRHDSHDSHGQGRAIPFELIIQAIEPQPSEPLHVQARNQHINEIKQLIELHEELITRLHNTDTIGLKASIDHHQQQIVYLRKSLDGAKHRCTGRTTNIALKTIAQAVQCPKQNIPIRDHHDTVESHRHLASMIESMLARLHLTGFVVDRFKLTLRYQGL